MGGWFGNSIILYIFLWIFGFYNRNKLIWGGTGGCLNPEAPKYAHAVLAPRVRKQVHGYWFVLLMYNVLIWFCQDILHFWLKIFSNYERRSWARTLHHQKSKVFHSFMSNICIAPFQENYSEALPTPARLKRAALRWEENVGDKVLKKRRSSEGRPFQVEGSTTENARFCLVEVRPKGTRRRPLWDERSDRELIALREGSRVHEGRQEQAASYEYCIFSDRSDWIWNAFCAEVVSMNDKQKVEEEHNERVEEETA